jgi:adenine-specific DNA-methyltransferase
MRTENGTREIRTLFDETLFSHPKSVELLKKALEISTEDCDYVLDFFAGSGTTAHAVIQLNAEDDGNRQFITVQIPEETDKKSEAHKAGYKTIFDITKARIEKASAKIAKENPDYKGDLGFKIFETIPVWDGYLDDIEELKEDTVLFDGSKLSNEELEVLLTTWKVHDGMELSHELSEIDLAGYEGYLGEETLYFVHTGFTTEALKKLIEKLDSDKTFEPSRIVIFGYNFASKHQRELGEALSSYANKKSIELDLIVRY